MRVFHRDVKPANIFLTRNNTVKLGDFGISKVLESLGQAAITFTGTLSYICPELYKGEPFTSDVWSLGCVLYELCTL
jgi:NIMA (never in mitosis gene a)-related kinase